MQGSGAGTGGTPGGDFNDAVRQAWTAWGDMMRGAGTPASPAAQWNDPAAWWGAMAGGASPRPAAPAEDLMRQLHGQAGGWFGLMQQLAARFAGRDASAGDIAAAWKQALGGGAAGAFTDIFAAMSRPGPQGMEAWFAQARPLFGLPQSMPAGAPDLRTWLGLPAFGFAREHQERWQRLAAAQLDHDEKNRAFAALMGEAAQRAFVKFEQMLAARDAPGRRIESARALFDLWIDAAEEAYAEIALSERFREAYGALVDAQMRLRAGMQREIEQVGQLLGTPTRTEVDAAHRRIVQLERELRRMRDALAGLQDRADAQGGSGTRTGAARARDADAVDAPAPSDASGSAGASRRAAKRAASTRAATGRADAAPASAKRDAAKPRAAKPAPATTARPGKPRR